MSVQCPKCRRLKKLARFEKVLSSMAPRSRALVICERMALSRATYYRMLREVRA